MEIVADSFRIISPHQDAVTRFHGYENLAALIEAGADDWATLKAVLLVFGSDNPSAVASQTVEKVLEALTQILLPPRWTTHGVIAGALCHAVICSGNELDEDSGLLVIRHRHVGVSIDRNRAVVAAMLRAQAQLALDKVQSDGQA